MTKKATKERLYWYNGSKSKKPERFTGHRDWKCSKISTGRKVRRIDSLWLFQAPTWTPFEAPLAGPLPSSSTPSSISWIFCWIVMTYRDTERSKKGKQFRSTKRNRVKTDSLDFLCQIRDQKQYSSFEAFRVENILLLLCSVDSDLNEREKTNSPPFFYVHTDHLSPWSVFPLEIWWEIRHIRNKGRRRNEMSDEGTWKDWNLEKNRLGYSKGLRRRGRSRSVGAWKTAIEDCLIDFFR